MSKSDRRSAGKVTVMLRIGFVWCCVFFVFSSVARAETKSDRAIYLFNEGVRLYKEEKFLEAADTFRHAYETKPTWKLLYNIAQSYAAAKKYGLALDYFEAFVAQGGDDIVQTRMKEVVAEMERLRMVVGVLDLDAPEGAELFVDGISRGKVPFPGNLRISVGNHDILVRNEGRILFEESVKITGSLTTKISVAGDEAVGPPTTGETEALDSSEPQTVSNSNVEKRRRGFLIAGINTIVLGAAGIGVGIGFTIKGNRDSERLEAAEQEYLDSNRTSQDAYQDAKDADDDVRIDKVVTIAGYTAGGVLAVTGVVFLVLAKKQKGKEMSWRPTLGGVGYAF